MKTLLVTGGAGFIGSCLVQQVVAGGDRRVVNLDKLTYAGNLDTLRCVENAPNYRFVHGDIADGELVAALLDQFQPTSIINLAAESHVDRSIENPAEFVQTNVVGTFQLLEATRRYWNRLSPAAQQEFRFLHVSTDEVFGSLGTAGKFTETTPYAPNSPYAASKASADHFVRAYHKTYGLPVLITNCSNNYGPFQFPEKLIPRTILNAIEGKPLPVYGDGGHIRDWLYVADHCRALRAIIERAHPGNFYNIGGNCERTNLDVVRTICAAVERLVPGKQPGSCLKLITLVADRPGHDRRYAIDATKLQRDLGWRPTESFDAGIEQTVAWYIENRAWVERIESVEHRRDRSAVEPKGTQL